MYLNIFFVLSRDVQLYHRKRGNSKVTTALSSEKVEVCSKRFTVQIAISGVKASNAVADITECEINEIVSKHTVPPS